MGQAWAHAARSEGKGTGKAPRPAAAEGGRAQAADTATRDKAQRKGKGTGRTQARAAAKEGPYQDRRLLCPFRL